MDTGSGRSRRQVGGPSAEQGRQRLREEDEEGKGGRVDLAHSPWGRGTRCRTQEQAGASSSHTTAVPTPFPKRVAISPRKEGAWDSMQPEDTTPRGSCKTQERKTPPRRGSGRRGQDRGTRAGLAPRSTGLRGHRCGKTRSPRTRAAGEARSTATTEQSTGEKSDVCESHMLSQASSNLRGNPRERAG